MAPSGVDAAMGCTLGFEGGGLHCCVQHLMSILQEAVIVGEKGRIVIPNSSGRKKQIFTLMASWKSISGRNMKGKDISLKLQPCRRIFETADLK